MTTPKKRRALTLEEKKAVIEAAKGESNQTKLAKRFDIPRGTLQGILNNKEAILQAIDDGSKAKRARLTTGKNENLDGRSYGGSNNFEVKTFQSPGIFWR